MVMKREYLEYVIYLYVLAETDSSINALTINKEVYLYLYLFVFSVHLACLVFF